MTGAVPLRVTKDNDGRFLFVVFILGSIPGGTLIVGTFISHVGAKM